MKKSKIEWCDSTWNPVTGCLHDCSYCYARRIAQRFGNRDAGYTSYLLDSKSHAVYVDMPIRDNAGRILPYPYGFNPTFHRYRLSDIRQLRYPQTIFVGSMTDLFGEWVPDSWIKEVFEACNAAPQHRYLFLTKNPDRYYQLGNGDGAIIPDDGIGGWFGASATTEEQAESAWENLNCTWLSVEPLHGDFSEEFFTYDDRYTQVVTRRWQWIVIGAETGNRKGKITPKREWIENIVKNCRDTKTPLFMKNSLKPIWGDELITEFPWDS